MERNKKIKYAIYLFVHNILMVLYFLAQLHVSKNSDSRMLNLLALHSIVPFYIIIFASIYLFNSKYIHGSKISYLDLMVILVYTAATLGDLLTNDLFFSCLFPFIIAQIFILFIYARLILED